MAETFFTDHIPPVELGDGSFFVELKHDLTPIISTPGKAIYVVSGNNSYEAYEDIGWIEGVIEYERHFEKIPRNVFPKGSNVELRVWLSQVPFSGRPGNHTLSLVGNHNPDHQVPRMKIEFDHPVFPAQARDVTHQGRTKRYEHNGQGFGQKEFRIRKWAVMDMHGNEIEHIGHEAPIPGEKVEEVLGYRLLIAFWGDRQRDEEAK